MTDTPRLPADDQGIFDFARQHLFSAVIGDVMDKIGLRRQFLPQQVQPLSPEMVIVGRAMPVTEQLLPADFEETGSHQPFGLMFRALDDLKPGEIYMCSGTGGDFAVWGEMMSLRAQTLGSAGAILDGYSRDTPGILKLGFPVFSHGRYAQDQGVRGYISDFRQPISYSNGAVLSPGDLVFGDLDGVVIVPHAAEREVLHLAVEKVFGENTVRNAILDGLSTQDAFMKYGIM